MHSIADCLRALGLDQYISAFVENDIDLDLLTASFAPEPIDDRP